MLGGCKGCKNLRFFCWYNNSKERAMMNFMCFPLSLAHPRHDPKGLMTVNFSSDVLKKNKNYVRSRVFYYLSNVAAKAMSGGTSNSLESESSTHHHRSCCCCVLCWDGWTLVEWKWQRRRWKIFLRCSSATLKATLEWRKIHFFYFSALFYCCFRASFRCWNHLREFI